MFLHREKVPWLTMLAEIGQTPPTTFAEWDGKQEPVMLNVLC